MSQIAGSLDTNVLVRILINDVPSQHKAVARLLEGVGRQFAVADTAIIELVFGLERYYALSRTAIAEMIGGLMQLPQINCNRELFFKALPNFTKHSNLSFEDCCLAVYAELNQAEPLWTFDRKLAAKIPNTKLVPVT